MMGWQPESAIAPSSTAARHDPAAAAVSFLGGCAWSMSESLLNFIFGPVVDEGSGQLIAELALELAFEDVGPFLVGRHGPIGWVLGSERCAINDPGPLLARCRLAPDHFCHDDFAVGV